MKSICNRTREDYVAYRSPQCFYSHPSIGPRKRRLVNTLIPLADMPLKHSLISSLRSIKETLPWRRSLPGKPARLEKQELRHLRAENARYKNLVNSTPIGHFSLDCDLRIVEVNPAGARFLAASRKHILGTPLLSHVSADDSDQTTQQLSQLEPNNVTTISTSLTVSEKTVPVMLHVTSHTSSDNQRNTFHIAMVDLSEHKATQRNLRIARDGLHHVVNHDPLTRLPNRCGFKEQLQQALATSGNKKVALLLLDLDHFKSVNDPLGHQIGDKLLREVAERLVICVKKFDIVGRLGGDEFGIILQDIRTVSEVAVVADKIGEILAQPYKSVSHNISLAASIGISVYPVHSDRPRQLICYADAAMNQAKSRGRNRIQFYTAALNATLTKRFELERDLRTALKLSQFELHYQPQYDLRCNKVSGYEVLLRWNHPVEGTICPDKFIDVAEATGLIEPIGEWIVIESCRKLKHIRAIDKNIKLSINVSAKQFIKGDLCDKITEILSRTGTPAALIELELTESALFDNVEHSVSMLQDLRHAGVSLAIDDFGTGYSSFSRLQQLPVSRVKIDRSFVQDIPEHKGNTSIVKAIISVAHELGIEVVAEGVETHKQALYLSEAGCDVLQGYYVGKPKAFEHLSIRPRLKSVPVDAAVA